MLLKETKHKGLSEPLGYILLFSLSIIVVGVLIGIGVPNLENDMNNKKLIEIEDSFEILHSNISDIVWLDNTTREMAIKTNNNHIQMEESNDLKIRFPSTGRQIYSTYQPIRYDNNKVNGTIIYENGSVITKSKSGNSMIRNPRIQSVDNTLILPFIDTNILDNPNNKSGIQTIRTVHRNTNTQNITVGSTDPEFVIESEYPNSWISYLENNSNFNSCSETGGNVACQIDSSIDTIQIRSVQIDVFI